MLLDPKANPGAAKVGDRISIIASPTEPLLVPPAASVFLEQGTSGTPVPGFLTFQQGTAYTFQSDPITSATANGTYYVQFLLTDLAGNINTYPADNSLSFTVDSVIPRFPPSP